MMTRAEMVLEIERVKTALEKTDSRTLKRDYGKYLRRLEREVRDYDKFMGAK